MINASELRIGNRVICASVTMIVTGWDIYQLNKYIRENDTLADKYEPIPLTPEILESAGFKEVEAETFKLDEIILTKNNADWEEGFMVLVENEYVRNTSQLHILQNLIFFLTGKELTINLHATV